MFFAIHFYLLFYRLFRSPSPVVRQQARTILIGVLFSFAPITAWLLLTAGFTMNFNPYLFFAPLVIFPATTGYTVTEMKKIARQKHLNLVFGIAEKIGRKTYNTAILVTPKGSTYTYQKTHLFDREKLFFTPGEKGYAVHKVEGVRIGLMVCFDWCFPEVTRILALEGAQIVCHPANLVMPYCQDAMKTRAIENRVFTITANRIGIEKRGNISISFTGQSQIVDPSGNVLASAGDRSESLKLVDIRVEDADNKSITANNDLFKDRRISLYKPLLRKSGR